jgi:hypothetical protein
MGGLSATATGITEGLTTSLGNFNQQYDNAAMNQLLGGGVGGVAQKACMAALGYDWELDFGNVMDAAYQSQYASTVMVPMLKRTYLFYNPAKKKPVFEYRGGILITPGCEIESYSASLVCVTQGEKSAYKRDIKCLGGTAQCPCLNAAPQVSITSTVSPLMVNIPVQGGKMTQGNPVDKAFSAVIDDSAYVYDHLRVQLFIAEDKKKGCLPEGHEDGVFYFPVTDLTPLASLGCELRADGTVRCASKLATDFFGFGNIELSLFNTVLI